MESINICFEFFCNFYADFFDGGESEGFAKVDTFELAKTVADALFISKNFMWDSLDDMKNLKTNGYKEFILYVRQ